MPGTSSIPPSAVAALNAGRKIEAVRIVRATQGIGLKEAKELVESYVKMHPELRDQIGQQQSRSLRSSVMWILFIAIVAWFAMQYLSSR
jgi:hypothetical protein